MENRYPCIRFLGILLFLFLSIKGQCDLSQIVNGIPNQHGIVLFDQTKTIIGFLKIGGIPNDVEVLSSGREFAVCTHSGEFMIIDRKGKQLFSTRFEELNDVDVLSESNRFLLTSRSGQRVFLYDRRNSEQRNLPYSFAGPTDADVLPNGNYLVCDSRANKIIELTPDGTIAWLYDKELARPMDALRLPNGNVLISDFDHHRILEVDRSGRIVSSKTGFDHPIKLSSHPSGSVLVADGDKKRLVEIPTNGNLHTIRDQLNYIQSAAFIPNENLYLAAIQNKFPVTVTGPAQAAPVEEKKTVDWRELFSRIEFNHPFFLLILAFLFWGIGSFTKSGSWLTKVCHAFAYGVTIALAWNTLTVAASAKPYTPNWIFWTAIALLALFTYREAKRSLITINRQKVQRFFYPFGIVRTLFLLLWPGVVIACQYYYLVNKPFFGYTLVWYVPIAAWGIGLYALFYNFLRKRKSDESGQTQLHVGSVRLAVPFSTGSVSEEEYEEEVEPRRDRMFESQASEYWANTSIIVIVLIAVCLYFIQLTSIPTDVHGDEGEVALYGIEVRDSGNWNIFDPGWYHIPNFFFLIPAWVMWLFGDNLFGIRMATSLIGVASIPIFYLLARRLLLPVPAALATFLFATCSTMVHYSRMGIGYNQTTLLTVAILYFIMRGIQEGSGKSFCVAGFLSALGMLSYQATKLLPFLVILTLIFLWIIRSISFRHTVMGLFTFCLAFWVSVSPFIGNHFVSPLFAFSRTNTVSIFSEHGRTYIRASYPPDTPFGEVLEEQVKRSFLGTIARPDSSPFYSNPKQGGMLDPIPGIFFVAGCAVLFFSVGHSVAWLLLFWMAVNITAGNIITNNPPAYQRLSGAIPFLLLIAAPVFYGMIQQLSSAFRWSFRLRAIFIYSLAALLLLMGIERYFHDIMKQPQFTDDSTRVAHYVQEGGPHRYHYLFAAHFYIKYGNIRFLAPEAKGENVLNPEKFLKKRVTRRGPVSFILIRGHQRWIDELRRLYPGGRELHHFNCIGEDPFTTYEVNL